jgi:hypothetical protein
VTHKDFAGMSARRFDCHLSVTAISDATPPQTRDSHAIPSTRSTHITVSPAVPTKGLCPSDGYGDQSRAGHHASKPPLGDVPVGDVSRFVDGRVAAPTVTQSRIVKIPAAGCSPLAQLAAFIQQRIHHVYRRQRPTPLPSRTAKSRRPLQLGLNAVGLRSDRVATGDRRPFWSRPA